MSPFFSSQCLSCSHAYTLFCPIHFTQPYDLMLFTNLFMMLVAFAMALGMDQFFSGLAFISAEPALAFKVPIIKIRSSGGDKRENMDTQGLLY